MFVNAGIAEHGDQFFGEELDDEGLLKEPDRRVLNVDMDAASDSTRLAVHYLRKNGKEGGQIVLTASLAGYLASAGAPLYSAAKHGMVLSFVTLTLILSRGKTSGADADNRCGRSNARPQTRTPNLQHRHISRRTRYYSHTHLNR